MRCNVFWGSHGCMLEEHDTGQHVCDCCNTRKSHRRKHDNAPATEPPMKDGVLCVGTWPYYGPDTAFFTLLYGKHFVGLPDEYTRLAALKEGEHGGTG